MLVSLPYSAGEFLDDSRHQSEFFYGQLTTVHLAFCRLSYRDFSAAPIARSPLSFPLRFFAVLFFGVFCLLHLPRFSAYTALICHLPPLPGLLICLGVSCTTPSHRAPFPSFCPPLSTCTFASSGRFSHLAAASSRVGLVILVFPALQPFGGAAFGSSC